MCYRCHKRIIYSLESVLLPLKTYYYNLYHNLLFLMYNIFLYTFSEYRFAIRACLNILPTMMVARRAGKTQLATIPVTFVWKGSPTRGVRANTLGTLTLMKPVNSVTFKLQQVPIGTGRQQNMHCFWKLSFVMVHLPIFRSQSSRF